MFGDPSLFAEFNKPRDKSDRILLETIGERSPSSNGQVEHIENGPEGNQHIRFQLGSDNDESQSPTPQEPENNEPNLESESGESEGDESGDGGEDLQESKNPTKTIGRRVAYDEFGEWKYVGDNESSETQKIRGLQQENIL